jgi:pimeloyl-ACP methyl ester carboxylesterase
LRPQRADVLVPDGGALELDLGGKRVQVLHLGFAQTVGDLFVWLPNDKVLFTGNPIIATPPALPWLLDGRLEESLQTLARVRKLVPDDAVVVPGHGAPVDPRTIDFNIAYLGRLKREVRDAVDRGLDEKATVQAVAMKEYEGYRIFPWVHAQINVPKAYEEMKRANGAPADAQPGMIEARFAEVNGLRMHYLAAGKSGEPVILLHGYAQNSHMWRPLMNELGKTRRVIAPDLRGFGDTTKAASGYDKKTMAQDVRALAQKLGIGKAAIAGHDIGLMVAYAYAAQYPSEVDRIALLDAFIPGVGDTTNLFLLRDLWHFHFYGPVPLALVSGRERTYFEHFWNDFAADGTKSVSEDDRRFYAAKYALPGAMKAGMEVFRNFDQDAIDNREFSKTKLTMPMLVLGGEKSGGNFLISQGRLVATNVEGVIITGSGHWLIDEQPGQVIPRLLEFFK